ncbi:MAG: hypothetical protein ACUVRV_03260 [Cyanobacteriota bacterium]
MRLSHPSIPVAYPQDPQAASAEVLTYAWSLNRILQGVMLDRALEQLDYDANSKRLSQEQLMAQSQRIPDHIKALLLLELLCRGLEICWQKELQTTCGEDKMRMKCRQV